MQKKTRKIIIILIIILLLVIVFCFVITESEENKAEEKQNYVLTQEELEELNKELWAEQNKGGTFKVSSAPDLFPKFLSGWLDPKYPKLGENQYISIKMKDPQGIQNVILKIRDDKNRNLIIEELSLTLVEGNDKEGIWAADWKVHDVNEIFMTTFIAQNIQGKSDNLDYFVLLDNK